MDDFWRSEPRGRFGRASDPFFDDMFRSPFDQRPYSSPFSILHESMQQMHRDMNDMMRHAFGNFSGSQFDSHLFPRPLPEHPQQRPAIAGPEDQNLDRQVQEYGLNSVFDDSFTNDWDKIEKDKNKLIGMQTDPKTGAKFYGRSHFHTYSATGDGKIEERKVIQDTHGNRMESMQRKLGDRVWAKTFKQNDKGEVNEDERLYGMDDQDKDRFISDWRSMNTGLPFNRNKIDNLDTKFNAIDSQPPNMSVDPNNVSTQLTLPPMEKDDSRWLDKLKFWKK